MTKTHLPFAKIVATPTPSSWSQAYGAGGLFMALSLTTEKQEHEETLGTLGKKILNDLEAEFFALEDKTLQAIKTVIEGSFSQVKDDILVSAPVAFVKDDILYAFLVGSGSLFLRRSQRIGKLLEEEGQAKHSIQAASGRLEKDDLVILQTRAFQTLIGDEKLTTSLEDNTLEDIAESLSPLVHGQQEGAASAIFFTYLPQPETPPEEDEEILPVEPTVEEAAEEKKAEPFATPFSDNQQAFPHPSEEKPETPKRGYPLIPLLRNRLKRLSHRQRLLLSIAGILIIVLLVSIVFTTQHAEDQKSKQAFAAAYQPAMDHFKTGKDLIGLNTPLARQELEKANATLAKTDGKLVANSEEAKKVTSLKSDVKAALEKTSGSKQAAVTPVGDSASKLLTIVKGSDVLYATQDDDAVYFLTAKEIGSKKSGEDKETLVKNDSDWKSPAGLGTFLGNFYVLDKDAGILKFVKGSDSYGKSSYLTGPKPDLTRAVNLTIDSSIYVLFSNGDIAKFTRGAPDTFKVTGLETPFNSPTRIYTTPDFSGIYVLDNGNGRIVKLGKDGTYQGQYQADALKKAKDFEINETDKKAYFLMGNKIYEMAL